YKDTVYLASYLGNTLHRINQPNLVGTACDFQKDAISLLAGTNSNFTLHGEVAFPVVRKTDTMFSTRDTIICFSDHINMEAIHAASGYNYRWSTGDTTAAAYITDPGSNLYWVSYGDGCHNYIDSFRIGLNAISTTITIDEFEL